MRAFLGFFCLIVCVAISDLCLAAPEEIRSDPENAPMAGYGAQKEISVDLDLDGRPETFAVVDTCSGCPCPGVAVSNGRRLVNSEPRRTCRYYGLNFESAPGNTLRIRGTNRQVVMGTISFDREKGAYYIAWEDIKK